MSTRSTRPDTLEDRIAKLEVRLQDGFLRIGAKMNEGIEVEDWERFWVELLREYETLNDELAAPPLGAGGHGVECAGKGT